MMVRLECTDFNHRKFWEAGNAGTNVHLRWGRIGSEGQHHIKPFPTVATATAYIFRKVREKQGRGYYPVEVRPDTRRDDACEGRDHIWISVRYSGPPAALRERMTQRCARCREYREVLTSTLPVEHRVADEGSSTRDPLSNMHRIREYGESVPPDVRRQSRRVPRCTAHVWLPHGVPRPGWVMDRCVHCGATRSRQADPRPARPPRSRRRVALPVVQPAVRRRRFEEDD